MVSARSAKNKPISKREVSTQTSTDAPSSAQGLSALRAHINNIDAQLLNLINERATLAQKIGHLKGGGVKYRPEREAEVLTLVQKKNQGPLTNKTVAVLFREIMSACLALEEPLRIAYLGPQGTFSETAANLHFGHAVQLMPQSTVSEALREVELGRCHFAVVPIENSIEGTVGSSLDLLITTRLQACGETYLPVHHHLLTHAKSLKKIKTIAAHPQALGQCQRWLKMNIPHAQTIPTVSNASAALMAQSDKTLAAIAGNAAADFYNLPKLASNIEDFTHNTTRFLVLGHLSTAPTGHDKTTLVVSARNVPGAVHKLLSHLAHEGVSMSRLESRPAPIAQVGGNKLWEYVFFMDIEGHPDDSTVAKAISAMRDEASFLKVIGGYPRSVIVE